MATGPEIVGTTTEAAFAVDPEGRIVAWNRAAERLFGHTETAVLQRRCWKVLAGRDVFGNRYCGRDCPLRGMARRHEAVHGCDLSFPNGTGEPVRTRVYTLVLRGATPAGSALVHLLQPIAPGAHPENGPPPYYGANHHRGRLTPRESEVLALLAAGKGTRAIAEELGLSVSTVRNHFDHILKKLKVHSRVQALALAHRLGLID